MITNADLEDARKLYHDEIENGKRLASRIVELMEERTKLRTDLEESLEALRMMLEQYCAAPGGQKTPDGRDMFDHFFMTAGEDASDVLIRHGKIKPDQMVAF